MDDSKLIELAAKSIGLTLKYNYLGGQDASQSWDPLEDDGDAFCLAVKLRIEFRCSDILGQASARMNDFESIVEIDGDEYAAIRRAIVLVAAKIK